RDRRTFLRPRLRLDRPPDDEAEVHDRDLEDHDQEHDLPDRVVGHRGKCTAALAGVTTGPPIPFHRRGRVSACRRALRITRNWEESGEMSHDRLRALLDLGEEHGCINMSAFVELIHELELDE